MVSVVIGLAIIFMIACFVVAYKLKNAPKPKATKVNVCCGGMGIKDPSHPNYKGSARKRQIERRKKATTHLWYNNNTNAIVEFNWTGHLQVCEVNDLSHKIRGFSNFVYLGEL